MQAIRPADEQPSFTKYFLEDPSLVNKAGQNQKKKIVLYDLPQIELYRKLNKPMVSQEKKRIIKQKLDLEQESLLQTKEREKRNEFFLNYSENPFIDLAPHLRMPGSNGKTPSTQNSQLDKPSKAEKQVSHDGTQKQSDDFEDQVNFDIVTELNQMVAKSPKPDFLKMKDDFRWMMKNADLFSNKVIEISAKKEDFEFFRQKKSHADKLVEFILEKGLVLANQKTRKTDKDRLQQRTRNNGNEQKGFKKDSAGKSIMQMLPENVMSFQQIIKISEENYFMRHDPLSQKAMNIFKISFNKNQKEMIGKELLNKYNFSFTSMVEKLQKIKIPIYRDISRMARRISLGKSTGKQDRFDYIDSYQLSFKTNSLNFADLMSVASGRFSPEFVYKTTNFDVEQNIVKQTSQTSSQQEQEQIFYDQNTSNMSVRFHNKGEQQQQIINYLKLQYNAREVNYKEQCQRYKQAIFADLNMKEKLVSTTIQDKKLHGGINKSIKRQLKRFVNMDEREIQIDRLIRMNRMNKSKNVSIKLGKILEAFDIKKHHDEVITKLGIMEEDNQSDFSDNDDEQKEVGKDKIKLKPKKDLNNLNNVKNTNMNKTFNGTTPQTPKFGKDPEKQSFSKTPQKPSGIYNKANTSRTPPKRDENINTSRTPQKRKQINEQNYNNSEAKNNSTVKKTGLWKY